MWASKMIQPSQISVRSKSVSARSPNMRFEVVELCSQLWLVVTVQQQDKWKGSVDSMLSLALLNKYPIIHLLYNFTSH